VKKPQKQALWAGAITASAILGVLTYRKIQAMQTPAAQAATEAHVAGVAERAAFAYVQDTYGFTQPRIDALRAWADRFRTGA
jgi:hypothetical protein